MVESLTQEKNKPSHVMHVSEIGERIYGVFVPSGKRKLLSLLKPNRGYLYLYGTLTLYGIYTGEGIAKVYSDGSILFRSNDTKEQYFCMPYKTAF